MFRWTPESQQSFEELKDRLTHAPILTLPQSSADFVVYCDASRVGLWCAGPGYCLRFMPAEEL